MQVHVPAWYDVLWSVAAVGHVVLLAVALTVWFRVRRDRSDGALELLVILVVPVVGAAAYLTGHALSRRNGPGGRRATEG